ncbi:MAG: hypothetical protein J5546_04565 [Lachnospiraceae bacterium]|nr:hypothetical protein [Lachnospiraceae bacterium]
MDNNEMNVNKDDILQPDQDVSTETKPETAEEIADAADEAVKETVDEVTEEVTEEVKEASEEVAEEIAEEVIPVKEEAPKPQKAAKPAKNPKAAAVNTVKKPLLSDAAKARIKSLIFPVVMTSIIVAVIFFILNHKNVTEEEPIIRVNKYEGTEDLIVLENSDLKLTMDPLTTYFDIEVKSTGKVWRVTPEDGQSDPIARGDAKNRVNSTMVITYTMDSGLEKEYNNYSYSIENGVYDIEVTKDYVKVFYSIGDVQKEFYIPPVTTAEKFDEYLSMLDRDASYFVSQYYKKYDPNKPAKKDDVETLKASYPTTYGEGQAIYTIREGTNDALKSKLQDYFESIGYTIEDYKADCELDQSEATNDRAVFNIAVYYRLEGKDLVVEIPYKEMQFSMEKPLFSITPLPMFGAGSTTDEGFIFVPEGGGAKINFNNGKTSQSSYETKVYGRDMALVKDAVVHDPIVNYNAFGIASNGNSFICILEDGASYANIQADISGRYNSYNFVNAKYSAILRERYNISEQATSAVYVFTPELPDEKLVERFRFVDSDNYLDMAKAYKDYLLKNFPNEFTLNDDTEAPVVIEVVAAVDKVKQVLGVPTSRPLKLTTFKEAKEMIAGLQAEGMRNMSVKLTGWMNGGVNQKILKKVKLVHDCGSSGDLKKLAQETKNLGIDFYLDGVTSYAYDSDLLDGFNSFTDSARFISKERAKLYQYSAVTFAQREGADFHYLLHADLITKMNENLYKAVKKYDANLSFREIGNDLSGDYYKKKTTTREAVRKSQMEQLSQFSQDTKVMINGGNLYAAMYSDMITNMDLRGSEYTIIDEFVPFYELAIHGYKNYVGYPINLTNDPTQELLTSAEYGAGLYFTLMKESPFALQKTLYTEYYGANYDSWHERMVSIYNRYNQELGHVFKQEMTNHETLEKGVTCTTYADGTKVYVNYNYMDKTANGKTIPARDYVVVR